MAPRSRDIERSLRTAGAELFAARGLAGTTVDEIARRAGANRERVYAYFGGKDGLFAAVLGEAMGDIADAVTLDAVTVRDIGAFAAELFDYHQEHPQLQRLLQWEALALPSGPVPDQAARRASYQSKVAVIAEAQDAGVLAGDLPADHLLFLVIAITAWWSAVPQLVGQIERDAPTDRPSATLDRRRASVRLAVERLALPPVS